MVRPRRIQPIAVVLSPNENTYAVSIISILDIDQRVGTLKRALEQAHGMGFVFVYDGFITDTATGQKMDALLMVRGTAWGVWRATALPYRYGGVGVGFEPEMDVPDMCAGYHGVFNG